jgi:hypothetical protein
MIPLVAGSAAYIEVNARNLVAVGHPLFNPTGGVVITVRNPSGTAVVVEAAMTNTATGVYTYTHQTSTSDPKGVWTLEFKSVNGAYTHISANLGGFELT